MQRLRTIRISHKILRELGVTRYAAYRSLKCLEKAGLISVVRRVGRCPIVTLLDAPKAAHNMNSQVNAGTNDPMAGNSIEY